MKKFTNPQSARAVFKVGMVLLVPVVALLILARTFNQLRTVTAQGGALACSRT